MSRTLILGTRGSQLAVAQSQQVADAIAQASGCRVELSVIRTRGDRIIDRPLREIGGKGLFTAELEAALLSGAADLAVHSLKDVPTEDPAGLVLAAFPERVDPRDVLVGASLESLPRGAVVGTGSERRRLQLSALRPDVEIRGVRGNVDTRIAKARSGDYDAVILAAAGLSRIERLEEVERFFDVEEMIPAPGQGALAIQCRADDDELREMLQAIHHAETAVCVTAERAFLHALSGGCSVPAACHAQLRGERLHVAACYARDGRTLVRRKTEGPLADAALLGAQLARELAAE